jgi:hypothetical protein
LTRLHEVVEHAGDADGRGGIRSGLQALGLDVGRISAFP